MTEQPSMTLIALAIVFFLLATAINQLAGANKADDGGKGDIRPSSVDLVVEACKNMTDKKMLLDKMHFHEKTCISVLHSDSRSTAAKDHCDLVVIALDMLGRRTSEVVVKVGKVTRGYAARNWTELASQYCATDYSVMVFFLHPVCRDIFLDLKPRGKKAEYHDAMLALDGMDRLGTAATDCFAYLGLDNNLTEEFENVAMHTSLAWALMEIALIYFDYYSQW